MQLVVEISEDTFFDLKKKQNRTEVDNAVIDGTPLPKGHGDLIDRDNLLVDSYYTADLSGNEINIVDVMTVEMADTIIEADRGIEK